MTMRSRLSLWQRVSSFWDNLFLACEDRLALLRHWLGRELSARADRHGSLKVPLGLEALEPRWVLSPVAVGDSYSLLQDHVLVKSSTDQGVLANDYDTTSGTTLNVVSYGNPSHGTLWLGSVGTFTYTPTSGYVGLDTFTYTISDGTANATALVTLNVTNQAPIAVPDAYSILHDETLTVTSTGQGVLANDYDPDGDALIVLDYSAPQHGTLSLSSVGTFTYAPTTGYAGSDQFTYTISDGFETATTSVSLTVVGSPVAPSITSGNTTAFTVGQSDTFTVTSSGYPTASLSETGTLPSGVTFTDNGDGTGTLSGTPTTSGSDTVTLTASNSAGNATQTFVLTVNTAPSNVAPSITSGNTTAFTVGQSDTFTVTSSGYPTASLSETGTLPSGVTFTGNGDGTGTLSGTPTTSGSDTVTLTANNGTSPNATQTFVLTVNAAPSNVAPSITSGNTTAFTMGQSNAFTVTSSGYPAASLSETGALPAGVTFTDNGDGTGTLGGMPLTSGSDTVTLTASNSAGNATQTFVLTVNAAPNPVAPSITSGNTTAFTVGQSGTFPVTSNGNPTALLSESGTLPAGVTFTDNGNGTGTLSGTPTTSGSDTVTLTASNGTSPNATQTFVLTVNAAPTNVAPSITSGNTTAFTVGQSGIFTVTTSGSPTASLSETGALPTGVTFTDNGDGTGSLAGTPLTSGSDTVSLTANNGTSPNATQTFVFTVNAAPSNVAPSITSGNTTAFTVGQWGTFIVTTSGSPTASLSESGTLPAGVTFADNGDGTGTLSGSPLTSGSDTITFVASNGTNPNATQTFVLTVNAAPSNVAPTITSGNATAFTVGQSGSFTVTTTGIPTASLSETGALPAGVVFADNGDGTGTLSGMPLSSGSDTITLTASNGTSPNATQTFVLTVNAAPSNVAPTITSGNATAFTVGQDGSFTVTTTGIPTASLSETGALPAGVIFTDNGDGTGTLSGSPLASGSDTVTFTASNGTSPNATQTFVLTVSAAPSNVAPTITSGNATAFTVGQSGTFTVTTSGNPTASLSETGALQAGITFTDNGDGTGTLSGTPLSSGSDTFTFVASNGTSPNATQTFVLTVNAGPSNVAPSITSGDTTAFTMGQSNAFTVTSSGNPTASLSETGGLPTGVTFTDNSDGTGTLSGTPLSSGSDTITLTASNGTSTNATQSFTLTVNAAPSNVAPTITSGNATAFTVGQSGSFTVTTTGIPTASLSETGTLPAGVVFADNGDGTGTLSGTPLSSGSDTITLTASNGTSPNATQTFVLTVNAAPSNVAPTITSGNATAFTVGQSGTFTVTTSGNPTASLSETGALPAGVIFTDNGDGTGTLGGTPLSSGSDTVTFTASNGTSPNATQTFVLTINAAPSNVAPSITSGNTTAFTVGQWGTFIVTTSGSPTASLSESGALPVGVALTDNGDGTGTLSGTPLASGSDTITLTASNGTSPNATQSFTLTVNAAPSNVAPSITSGDTTAFTVGQSGTFTVTTSGIPTASLSESGTLPSGVMFIDNGDGTGTLSGTPLNSGSDTFTLTASNGTSPNATQTFVLTVNAAPSNVAPTITSGNTTAFTVGQDGSFTVTTTGIPTASLSESGTLPVGVAFTDNGDGTGTLSGSPLTSGSDTITFVASNGTSPNATQTFVLTVNAAPSNVAPTITSGNTTAFTVGQSGSFTVTTAGNPTASLSETGTLPAGVVFADNGDGTGTLSGTPLSSGSDTITFVASNGTSPNATQTFVLTVNAATFNAAPRITSGNTTAFTVGQAGSFTVTTTGIPTAWLSETGALQAGVIFADNGDGTGTLSGTPLSSGSDTITLTARNGTSPNATQTFVLTVNAAPSNVAPTITSGNTTAFTVGQSGSFTVTTAGNPTASLSETGTLPAGVVFADNGDGTGTLSGTPLASGSDTITLTASNGTSPNATQSFTLTVNAAPSNVAPSITSGDTTAFTVGQSGTFTVTTSGIPMASLSESGVLPAGVVFTDNGDGTGTLGGTPLSSGSDTFTFVASNGTSPNATQTFVLTVNAAPSNVAPTITSGNATAFTVGQDGSFTVTTTGIPTAWLSETGALPAGVIFTDNGDGTGTLGGTPLSSGSDTVTFTASNGTSPNATQTFVLTINAAPGNVAPSITSASNTTFTASQSGTFTVTTTGIPTASLSETGALPAGVNFADNGDGTGTLSGTPLASGSDTITLTASNGTSPNATQTFVLTVNAAPSNVAPSITSGNATAFTVGQSGAFIVTTNGSPTASLSESGTLPAGITFTNNGDGTGTLGGTPLTSGSDTVTLTASNGTSPNATQTFVLTVNAAPSNVAPTISSGNTTAFTVGQDGTFTVTTSGIPTASLSETGALPTGVTFTDNGDGTGTLSGMPLTSGSNTITLTASNGTSPNATQTFVLTVNAAPSNVAPTITSRDTTAFTVGQSGSFTVTTLGYPTASLSESGTLPAGVTFTDNDTGTGTLSGIPTTAGSDTFTITASNGTSPDATQTFVLTVNAPGALTITSTNTVTFTVGQSNSFTVTTSGSPTAALSEPGDLPNGVTFTDNGNGTATLGGTPTENAYDLYAFSILASNGVAPDATQNFTLLLVQAPSFTSANSTAFTVGQASSFTVTSNGWPMAALSETGTLPAGVTFTDNGDGTGALSGTPEPGTTGTYPFTLTASDGVGSNATQSFTLTVNATPSLTAPSLTSTNTTTFTVGQAGSFTVTTTGYPTASLSESGTLPAGVTFTDDGDGTGTLAGTPLIAGTYTFTFMASNGVGANATQSFTLTVSSAPTPASPTITSSNSTAFSVGQMGSFTVTTTGTPIASLSEVGVLPAGVTFIDNGNGTATLAGMPPAGMEGTYTFTITASNGVGSDATQSFTLTVNAPPSDSAPVITSADSTTFTEDQSDTFIVTTSGYPAAALSEVGALPGGVTFTNNDNGTATLAGIPLATGSYTIIIKACNDDSDATEYFTLYVDAPAQPAMKIIGPTVVPGNSQYYYMLPFDQTPNDKLKYPFTVAITNLAGKDVPAKSMNVDTAIVSAGGEFSKGIRFIIDFPDKPEVYTITVSNWLKDGTAKPVSIQVTVIDVSVIIGGNKQFTVNKGVLQTEPTQVPPNDEHPVKVNNVVQNGAVNEGFAIGSAHPGNPSLAWNVGIELKPPAGHYDDLNQIEVGFEQTITTVKWQSVFKTADGNKTLTTDLTGKTYLDSLTAPSPWYPNPPDSPTPSAVKGKANKAGFELSDEDSPQAVFIVGLMLGGRQVIASQVNFTENFILNVAAASLQEPSQLMQEAYAKWSLNVSGTLTLIPPTRVHPQADIRLTPDADPGANIKDSSGWVHNDSTPTILYTNYPLFNDTIKKLNDTWTWKVE